MVYIKVFVFSFIKFVKVDSLLGFEMKLIGEVMGLDINF